MTLQESITEYLRNNPEWIHSGTLERMEWKYLKKMRREMVIAKPGTVGRTLRLLEEKGIIAVQHPRGSAEYRFIPPGFREKYRPLSTRTINPQKLWK